MCHARLVASQMKQEAHPLVQQLQQALAGALVPDVPQGSHDDGALLQCEQTRRHAGCCPALVILI